MRTCSKVLSAALMYIAFFRYSDEDSPGNNSICGTQGNAHSKLEAKLLSFSVAAVGYLLP